MLDFFLEFPGGDIQKGGGLGEIQDRSSELFDQRWTVDIFFFWRTDFIWHLREALGHSVESFNGVPLFPAAPRRSPPYITGRSCALWSISRQDLIQTAARGPALACLEVTCLAH